MAGRRKKGGSTNSNLSRTEFEKMQVVFDLSSFQLSRTDKKWFQGNRIMRNLSELSSDVDSIDRETLHATLAHYESQRSYFSYLNISNSIILPANLKKVKKERDSLNLTVMVEGGGIVQSSSTAAISVVPGKDIKIDSTRIQQASVSPATDSSEMKVSNKKITKRKRRAGNLDSMNESGSVLQTRKMRRENRIKKELEAKPKANLKASSTKRIQPKANAKRPVRQIDLDSKLDSIFLVKADRSIIDNAASRARSVKNQLMSTQANLNDYKTDRTVFLIQWHKILASSLACIAMFLIGAPLGAIIKKGGLGVPFLVSILFFIIYYLVTMTGEKWAKQSIIPVPIGVWTADLALFVVGLIFLRQARLDVRLFEADFYSVLYDKAKKWLILKKILKAPLV
jgi:lipopolysaccharide export system permease protein